MRQAACDGFLQMRGVSCQLPASHGKSVGAFGGLDRIRGRQEDILTSPFALARATGDAGIGAASHHPVSAGAEGRTGAARLPTATLHCRLALALVASFFVLTIPLAPNAGAEESVVAFRPGIQPNSPIEFLQFSGCQGRRDLT